MTDITDPNRFFVRIVGDNEYAKVEAEMDRFDPISAESLEKPIKKGTICASKFSVDDKWYRSRVLHTLGKGLYEVEFIDFGNVDEVSADDLKRLPQKLVDFEPQAKLCTLSYIRVNKNAGKFAEEGAKIV